MAKGFSYFILISLLLISSAVDAAWLCLPAQRALTPPTDPKCNWAHNPDTGGSNHPFNSYVCDGTLSLGNEETLFFRHKLPWGMSASAAQQFTEGTYILWYSSDASPTGNACWKLVGYVVKEGEAYDRHWGDDLGGTMGVAFFPPVVNTNSDRIQKVVLDQNIQLYDNQLSPVACNGTTNDCRNGELFIEVGLRNSGSCASFTTDNVSFLGICLEY